MIKEDRIRIRKPILLGNDTMSTNSVVLEAKDVKRLRESSHPVRNGEKGAKVSKCRKKYKSYSNTVKSDSKSLAKSHDVTPRSVSSFSRLVKVLVDACD